MPTRNTRRPPRRRKSTYRPKQDIRRTVDELSGQATGPAAQAHPPAETQATQGRQQVARLGVAP